MSPLLTVFLLAAPAPGPALPDLPAPLGMLDGVLAKGSGNDRTVEISLPDCDHKVPVNLSRFIGGTGYAMQQMVEWLNLTPGLTVFPQGALAEVTAGITQGAFTDTKACGAVPRDVAKAPAKLCPGVAADHAWMLVGGKPAALVRWGASAGKGEAARCLPKLTGVLFDGKGVARIRYEADFGAAAGGALLGDALCRVTFTFDPKTEVFHAARKGCKGP